MGIGKNFLNPPNIRGMFGGKRKKGPRIVEETTTGKSSFGDIREVIRKCDPLFPSSSTAKKAVLK